MDGTQLDKARAIARWLHHALAQNDPEWAAKIAKAAHHAGETWLAPTPDTATGARLTRNEVAELGNVQAAAVSQWSSRGIQRDGRTVRLTRGADGRYDPQEALDFIALLRTHIPSPRRASE